MRMASHVRWCSTTTTLPSRASSLLSISRRASRADDGRRTTDDSRQKTKDLENRHLSVVRPPSSVVIKGKAFDYRLIAVSLPQPVDRLLGFRSAPVDKIGQIGSVGGA